MTPFKFQNAQACRHCNEKKCEITHLALCCRNLSDRRLNFLTDILNDLHSQTTKLTDEQQTKLEDLLQQKILQAKIQKMSQQKPGSSNSAIDANFLNNVIDYENRRYIRTDDDEKLLLEFLGVGRLRDTYTTKRFLDYLITTKTIYQKQPHKQSKNCKKKQERDPMEIDSDSE